MVAGKGLPGERVVVPSGIIPASEYIFPMHIRGLAIARIIVYHNIINAGQLVVDQKGAGAQQHPQVGFTFRTQVWHFSRGDILVPEPRPQLGFQKAVGRKDDFIL